MTDSPQTNKIMAALREKIESISFDAANSAERCRPFRANDPAYGAWIERHMKNGYVLHRDTAGSRRALLHAASCPAIAADDEGNSSANPRVGAPTKGAARAFALNKKWKLLDECEQCSQPAAATATS